MSQLPGLVGTEHGGVFSMAEVSAVTKKDVSQVPLPEGDLVSNGGVFSMAEVPAVKKKDVSQVPLPEGDLVSNGGVVSTAEVPAVPKMRAFVHPLRILRCVGSIRSLSIILLHCRTLLN